MKRRRVRSQIARAVGYAYGIPEGRYLKRNIFNEHAMERLLLKAKAAGVVTDFDTGRGAVVWFNGTPGRELRKLRAEVLALMPAETRALH